MSEDAIVVDDAVLPDSVDIAVDPAPPEVDLSAVPEKARDYVDSGKYEADTDYKRAVDHGWKTREQHEVDGGDEADYTGFRQFNRRYDDRQDSKALKNKMSEMEGSVNSLIDSMADDRNQAVKQALSAKEAEFKLKVEEGDTEGAVKAQNELYDIHNQSRQASQPRQSQAEAPIFANFRADNPILDSNSPDYNSSFDSAITQNVNDQLNYASNGNQIQLPDQTVKSILDSALQKVANDFGLNKPAKATPKTPPRTAAPSGKKGSADPVKHLNDAGKKIYARIESKYDKPTADRYAQKSYDRRQQEGL